jgi:hypothetical protein
MGVSDHLGIELRDVIGADHRDVAAGESAVEQRLVLHAGGVFDEPPQMRQEPVNHASSSTVTGPSLTSSTCM